MNHLSFQDPTSVSEAIRLLTGEPELVVVDFRVLRLLMGELAHLIVLERVSSRQMDRLETDSDQGSFAWDDESPCS